MTNDQAPPCEVTLHRSLAHFNQRSFSREQSFSSQISLVEIAEQFFTKKSEENDF
jgi:hypothetical protein